MGSTDFFLKLVHNSGSWEGVRRTWKANETHRSAMDRQGAIHLISPRHCK